MSAPKKPAAKLPAHGTRARYRLELKAGPGGKGGKPCDRCKAANAKAVATARANRNAKIQRSKLSLVPDVVSEDTIPDTTEASDTSAPKPRNEMETAVRADLAEIGTDEQVPFHRSLAALALRMAQEIDAAETPTARSSASRQLFEVLKSLRTRKEGDGNTALDIVLSDFGLPLVAGDTAPARHASKPRQPNVRPKARKDSPAPHS